MKFLEVFGLSFVLCMAVVKVRVGAMSPRIVGGKTATKGQFPYQISMILHGRHYCGGSIISKNYILTAAHCVSKSNGEKYDTSEIKIRAGTIKRYFAGVVVGVSEITVHANYSFPENDLALLKLASPLKYTDYIKPIGLVKDAVPDGASILASGWGHRYTGGTFPKKLQYVYLSAADDDEYCRKYSTILCVKSPSGQGICQGDSGGPGVHNGKLAGVVSFTAGSCGSTRPDGFAKISVLRDWVIDNSNLE